MFGERLDLAVRYVELLAGPGVQRGLLGPREAPRLWKRHVLNCAAAAPLFPPACSVLDVGSGAGLPGIVLALARPDLRIRLLEPMARRAVFLEECVAALALGAAVTVIRGRAEQLHGDVTADVVTARALAPLPRLLPWCWPLVRPGGALVAYVGERAAAELAECALPPDATAAIHRCGPVDAEATLLVADRRP